MSKCAACTRNTPDTGRICHQCGRTLDIALANIGALANEIDIVRARQVRYDHRVGSRPTERPVPVDLRAREVEHDVRNTLTTWIRDMQGLPHDPNAGYSPTWPNHTIPAMCNWLGNRLPLIRMHPKAEEILDEIVTCERRLIRLADRPPQRMFAGPCECGEDLYVTPGQAKAKCAKCERSFDVATRRQWLLDQAEDRLATATETARAVSWLGDQRITTDLIRQWASRGRLEVRSVTITGRPLYRIGDVLDLLPVMEQTA